MSLYKGRYCLLETFEKIMASTHCGIDKTPICYLPHPPNFWDIKLHQINWGFPWLRWAKYYLQFHHNTQQQEIFFQAWYQSHFETVSRGGILSPGKKDNVDISPQWYKKKWKNVPVHVWLNILFFTISKIHILYDAGISS